MLNRCAIAVLATLTVMPVAAENLAIDPAHSSVNFKVDHMVVSKVRGSFGSFEGTIRLDRGDMSNSSVEVAIDVTSIDTANDKRDDHLRSADFFDAPSYPQITFKSTTVKETGSGYVATGDLTIKGHTRRIDLPFVVNGPITDPWGNTRIGVEIEPITIDRRDFGLTWSQTLETGGLLVGNEVGVEIEVEAVGVNEKSDA